METIIVTDSCCDLPYSYIVDNHIEVLPLTITVDGKEKKDELAKEGSYEAFYQQIADGMQPKTSQVNAYEFKDVFMKHIKAGKAVIYIGFSAALSGCVNSARMAAEEIQEEIPQAKIAVIDSKCASMGQGLLIYLAIEELKKGASMEQVIAFVEQNKLRINHYFTVMSLEHLYRGGRISKTSATLGTLLHIKPILHIDDEGKLIPGAKVKGRKKAVKMLVETVKERIVNPKEQVVFISHAAAEEEAVFLKKAILESCQVKDVWISYIGATIGTHVGPGTLAVFFVGDNRE